MSGTLESGFQEALQLSEDSRLQLVERLILASPTDEAIEAAQIKVAEARLGEMLSGAVSGVAVEQALRKARIFLPEGQ